MKAKGIEKVLIIAGGTGGHIFPALAVAQLLKKRGVIVFWLGSDVGLEKNLVPPHFPLVCINARRLRGKGIIAYLTAPWQLLKSLWQAHTQIRKICPDVVLAMGGYASAPGGLAAKLAGVPLVIHEQNAVAGYTNRLLAKIANQVLAAYPGEFAQKEKARVIGNPVRDEIIQIPAPDLRLAKRTGPLRIFVLGGSQGARALNRVMVEFAKKYPHPQQIEIRHQTGKYDYDEVKGRYDQLAISAKPQAFIEDMAEVYQWADLLICRAGALTVAEIAAAGVASILIPFPAAVDNHQWHNARVLENAGAALILLEKDLDEEKLIELVQDFGQNRAKLLQMAEKARQCAHPQATADVAEILLKTAGRQPPPQPSP
jgi:UDP-N-acetylglucosamine--N-acetylmuramyl-(pentapeptide) pyrophosphoryl-undecaprenol N-acetylglucosamine transferase